MKQILDNLSALGPRRLAILGVTALVVMGALLFGLSTVLAPNWRPVAADLSASEGAAMVTALEQAGYQPRISQDGTIVSLPDDQIARARMVLAEAGLAAESLPGWELFDAQSGLGMNTFLQRVNRLRALEGELSRSIQTLDVVESARVHLVLPEREAFSADRPEPSAAIIIRTKRGAQLERRQAVAVRALVAGALPGLLPGRVTVLSASGETILSSEGEGIDGAAGIHSARIAIEERIARNVEQMLSARVGAGNVRVRVAAELATTREVIRKEIFDPEGQVPRQTRSISDSSQNSEGAGDTVDVQNNIPGGLMTGEGGDRRQENRARSEDEIRFEIGSTRSETVIEPGGLRRLSVAVLVNGSLVDGTYQDRDSEELERLAQLVRSTMGFDAAGGDLVTVDSLQFGEGGGLPMAEATLTPAERLLGHLPSLIRWGVALLIVLIVVVFAVRPALARLQPKAAAEAAEAEARAAAGSATPEAETGTGEEAQGETAGQGSAGEARKAAGEEDEEEYVSLASVRGTLTKRHLEELGNLVEADGAAALRQIRVWLNQKG